MANDNVILRFESSIQKEEDYPLLLSGPLEVFATADVLTDLYDKELYNAFYDEETIPSVIIFIKDVAAEESQTHRGAYFLYVGRRDIPDYIPTSGDWQEILLGTHAHANKEILDQFEGLDYNAITDDSVILVKPDKTFEIKKVDEIKAGLPAFPIEVQNKLKERELYENLQEPEEDEFNHLDAPLEELLDTYDWYRRDANGNYTNLSIGNCKEIYRALIKANKRLYLTDEFGLSKESGIASLDLDVFSVNFDPTTFIPDVSNVQIYTKHKSMVYLELTLDRVISDSDELFVFDGETLLTDAVCRIRKSGVKKVLILLNRRHLAPGVRNLSVLSVKDYHDANESRIDIFNAFEDKLLTLEDIEQKLIELYVEGEFNRAPNVPQLYLATDSHGNMHWENKLLPAQSFYAKTLTVTQEYISKNTKDGNVHIKFEGAKLSNEYGDFPILLIDNYFAFDIIPLYIGDDVEYSIPEDSKYFDYETTVFTLVVIKNSANGSLADEIAERYVSKEDAIAILSHGKVDLKDFAKLTDLFAYAKINHTHGQYALKGHNHDYRYANYYHTHPELVALFKELSGTTASEEDIQRWIDKIAEQNSEVLESFINELGIKKENGDIYFEDTDILLTETAREIINAKLQNDNIDMPMLTDNATIAEAIQYLALLFEHDTVLSSQVLTSRAIPVKLTNGNIGGITTNRIYVKNTPLQKIIEDILNPYSSVSDVRKHLLPDANKTEIHWFKFNNTGEEVIEVDPMRLRYQEEQESLLFTVTPKNEFGTNTEYIVTDVEGNEKVITTIIKLDEEKYYSHHINGKTYYEYDTDFDFSEIKTSYAPINLSWTNITITDSYGLNISTLNPDNDSINIPVNFNIVYADYFVGALSDDNLTNITKNIILSMHPYYGNQLTSVSFTGNKKNLVVFIASEIVDSIKVHLSDTEISGYFKEIESPVLGNGFELYPNKYYYGFSYKIMLSLIDTLPLSISIEEE